MDLLRSLPLGLYLEKPYTWLHQLDPRVKLAWLLSFLLTPLLANPPWRIALVVLLIALTMTAGIPLRTWRQQMGWLLLLCLMVFFLTAIAPDSFAIDYQPRLREPAITPPAGGYQYVLVEQGWLTITRQSLDLSLRISTLIFTLIYSSNLFLLSTAPEEIAIGLEAWLRPLQPLGVPVTEIILTLTLSLRFIPLVLEEVQNLSRSVQTRAINWKKLGIRGSLQLWLGVAECLLENLLRRAEQIALAMDARGFTHPNQHRVQWHQLRLGPGDIVAITLLIVFWVARLGWGNG